MVWSHNDQWMVTGDTSGYIKYWQSNMNNVNSFQAHQDPVRGLRYLNLLQLQLTFSHRYRKLHYYNSIDYNVYFNYDYFQWPNKQLLYIYIIIVFVKLNIKTNYYLKIIDRKMLLSGVKDFLDTKYFSSCFVLVYFLEKIMKIILSFFLLLIYLYTYVIFIPP